MTVPVFLTRNDHWILSPRSVLPSPSTSVTAADLVSCSAAAWLTGVSVARRSTVTVALAGFLPVAVAVLETTPASTSAWVTVYAAVAVHVVDAPGASVVTGQVTAPAFASRDRHAGDGHGAGVLDQERPLDLVAQVGLAVAVDVGHGSRLGQLAARRPGRPASTSRTGADVTVAPAGLLPLAVAVLLTDAGVDVGLGDRVRRRRRAGRRRARRQRRDRAGDRHRPCCR